jgi:RimJ/RimL family protein N-acetyltransferase
MIPCSRGISLRQITEADIPFLFRLFTDPSRCHLWMHGRRVYDERGFQDAWSVWTAESMAAKFLVESAGRPVGLVFDHDRTLEDGSTQVTALLEEESTGHGGGVVATALFLDWLFESLPFRKVYLKVFGYNPVVVRMLRKLGFAEEGVLKRDRFWGGAYWDLHIFALYREAWPDVRARTLGLSGQTSRDRPVPNRKEATTAEVQVHPPSNSNGRVSLAESVS